MTTQAQLQAMHVALRACREEMYAVTEGMLKSWLWPEAIENPSDRAAVFEALGGKEQPLAANHGIVSIDRNIKLIRQIEAAIGRHPHIVPDWLTPWIDTWEALSNDDVDAMLDTEPLP